MNHEFWYLSRAAGFTAYLLLFVSVALGIAMGTRLVERFVRRNVVFDLHRFTTILALVFTLFHAYILLGDSYFSFNVWQLSLPFMSPYRTWQTAVGVFALYALILLVVSFYIRQFIGYRAWRALHFTTFAMFAGAMLHGIVGGTDTTEAWAKAIYVGTAVATVGLVLYRIQYHMPDGSFARTFRLASGFGTVVAAILLVFATGMLTTAGATNSAQPLASDAAPSDGGPAPATGAHPFLTTFSDDVTGKYVQTTDANGAQLTLDGASTGDVALKLHVELVQATGRATTGAGESSATPQAVVTTNRAELLDASSSAILCDGKLSALNGGAMRFTCDGQGPYAGVQMSISGQMQSRADGTFSGVLSGRMLRTT